MKRTSPRNIVGISVTALFASALALWLSHATAPSMAAEAASRGKEHQPVMMLPSDLKWVDSPALPVGVKVSILYGDMKKAEPVGFRIRLPAGGILASHTHPVHERVTVISGHFAMGEGERFDKGALKALPVGSVAIFPTGCPMFGFASEETVIQVNAEGPWGITYINPDDDPRNKK